MTAPTPTIKPHDITGNVTLQPKPTASPWPIITDEARAAWDALQKELADGYPDDAIQVGAWFIGAWERTYQQPAPPWVACVVPAASLEPAPVAAIEAAPVTSVNLPTQPMGAEDEPQEAPEPALDATRVIGPGEALTALLPPADPPTAILPAQVEDGGDAK